MIDNVDRRYDALGRYIFGNLESVASRASPLVEIMGREARKFARSIIPRPDGVAGILATVREVEDPEYAAICRIARQMSSAEKDLALYVLSGHVNTMTRELIRQWLNNERGARVEYAARARVLYESTPYERVFGGNTRYKTLYEEYNRLMTLYPTEKSRKQVYRVEKVKTPKNKVAAKIVTVEDRLQELLMARHYRALATIAQLRIELIIEFCVVVDPLGSWCKPARSEMKRAQRKARARAAVSTTAARDSWLDKSLTQRQLIAVAMTEFWGGR